MPNPIEVINLARQRAGKVAALNVTVLGSPVCLLTAFVALELGQRSGQVWRRMGIALSSTAASRIRISLLALAGAGLMVTAWSSWRAYRQARDLKRLAARLDGEINAHQEILTFGEVIAGGTEAASTRSPLFPVLWQRVSEYLSSFDPAACFRINMPRLLARSALLTVTWLVLLFGSLILFSSSQRPPYYNEARRLAELANEIDKTTSSAQTQALARRLRAGARALLNPNTSDKEKLIQLTALRRELEQAEPGGTHAEKPQAKAAARAGGASAGQGSANQRGTGAGKQNQGQGEGGKGGEGRGLGKQRSAGAATEEQGLLEQARNELSKVEKQLETGTARQPKSATKIGDNNPQGQQRQTSGGQANVNPLRPGNQPVPAPENKEGTGSRRQQTARGEATPKAGAGTKNPGAGHGDTRLGETPASRAYARFYKPGEHGPALGIKDARYVTVSIPPAAEPAAGGKIIAGGAPSKAATPYANLPLPTGAVPANPQEQQLVPPRYRDLLR
jgi:hypothetical protein